MATSQNSLAWMRGTSIGGQLKEQEKEDDRRRDGQTTSTNEREWGAEIPGGQLKTGKGRKVLL